MSKHYENESDLDSYSAFTNHNYFPADKSLYNRKIIKLTTSRRSDLDSVIDIALEHLNKIQHKKYEKTDFQIGFQRSEAIHGSDYLLYFKRFNQTEYVRLTRPPQTLELTGQISNKQEIIHFIIPYSVLEAVE